MRKRIWLPLLVLVLASAGLLALPRARPVAFDGGYRSCRARVLEVDASAVERTGLVDYGTEKLRVELLDGPDRGRVFAAENELRAQPDIDKRFAVGDIALVACPPGELADDCILDARDHWRLGRAAALFVAFAVLLVAFSGLTGLSALFSFVFSCLAVWKLLIPLCLDGWNPLWTTFLTVCLLTAVIMYLVAGATRKGFAAFLGAMLGIVASMVLSSVSCSGMHVTGATMPYVQALVYAGCSSLDILSVFNGAVILASSGAVMDLAMDIAAGVGEVRRHLPALPRIELFKGGMRIGRSVVGTMTTTLLLAYSGGYLTLLMLFAAQGTPPVEFLNSTLVSAEIVKTLVGSFGLVLVAPFTALVSAAVYGRNDA